MKTHEQQYTLPNQTTSSPLIIEITINFTHELLQWWENTHNTDHLTTGKSPLLVKNYSPHANCLFFRQNVL